MVLDQVPLEAAISGVVYEEIEGAKTVADAANQALLHHLHHVPPSFSKYYLHSNNYIPMTIINTIYNIVYL